MISCNKKELLDIIEWKKPNIDNLEEYIKQLIKYNIIDENWFIENLIELEKENNKSKKSECLLGVI